MGNVGATLLPVLGGFFFLYFCHYTKFYVRRLRGYALFFLSACVGFGLVSGSYLVCELVQTLVPAVFWAWEQFAPTNDGYAGTFIGSFLLSIVLLGLNLTTTEDEQSRKVVEDEGNDLEYLLNDALERAKLVLVVLRDRQVYVGFVTSNVDPNSRKEYARLLKVASGYRTKESRHVRIKTRYGKVLKGIRSGKEKLENVRLDDLNVVIPADHISSVSYFNTGIEHLFDEEVPTVSNDPNGEDFLASDQ
jgi:small nuclear ribonucleoprotein (snRNP)-like protein